MKCENCNGEQGITAMATRRPMRDASEYELKCPCGHRWLGIKSMRRRHLPENQRRELKELWDSVEYIENPISKNKKANQDARTLALFLLEVRKNISLIKDVSHAPNCSCSGCRMDIVMDLARQIRDKKEVE